MIAILFASSNCLRFDSIQLQIWWLKSHNPSKKVIHVACTSRHITYLKNVNHRFCQKSLVLNCYKLMLCIMDAFSILYQNHLIYLSFTFFVLFFFIVFHQLRILQKTSSRMTVTSLMHSAGRKTFRIFLDPEFSSFLLI